MLTWLKSARINLITTFDCTTWSSGSVVSTKSAEDLQTSRIKVMDRPVDNLFTLRLNS